MISSSMLKNSTQELCDRSAQTEQKKIPWIKLQCYRARQAKQVAICLLKSCSHPKDVGYTPRNTRRYCRVIKQQVRTPNNITNYKSMLEATDFSIFKSESISEYTDSLSEYCRFCFNTPCHLETIYVSATNVSSLAT